MTTAAACDFKRVLLVLENCIIAIFFSESWFGSISSALEAGAGKLIEYLRNDFQN